MKPLWACPRCGRAFANQNQTHTCAPVAELGERLAGVPPDVVALFERFRALIERCGPVTVLPEKTRIAFQVRMSFAVAIPRRRWLDGHLVLARRVEDERFRRIETYSPRNHAHLFRVSVLAELDERFAELVAEAYQVGAQRHLTS